MISLTSHIRKAICVLSYSNSTVLSRLQQVYSCDSDKVTLEHANSTLIACKNSHAVILISLCTIMSCLYSNRLLENAYSESLSMLLLSFSSYIQLYIRYPCSFTTKPPCDHMYMNLCSFKFFIVFQYEMFQNCLFIEISE